MDGKSHIEGTEVEFDVEKSRSKWIEIENNEGKKVTTIPVWTRCLHEYAGAIVKHDAHKRILNTSTKGVKISGVAVKSWDDINIEPIDFDIDKKIRKHLAKHPPKYEDTYLEEKGKAIVYLKKAKHDLEKLFLNLDDLFMIGRREEDKALSQFKVTMDAKDFGFQSSSLLKNFSNMYQEPCRLLDQYKQTYFTNELFSLVLLDTCQHSLFINENKCASLKNIEEHEYLRLKGYSMLRLVLYREIHYYMGQIINLLENGPDLSPGYFRPEYKQWLS